MNQKVTTTLFTCLALFMMVSQSQAQVSVTDDITSDVTWTANNTYMLDGLIFVDDGATLTIEPGTVIKGLEQGSITTGDGASALIVRRGGKIYAEGTASNPIIFTSELDDTNDALDLDQRDRGLWGGVIILGKATTNMPTTDNQIEGIDILTDPALYGGTNDADNSGTLRYVSIRHGGFSISGVEGDEINGLTMGAVGSGTTIEYVEVYANFDDCYEWFGGTVNTRYMVGAFCGDDSYDYDQGFRGKGQFWFSIHDTDVAGRGGEHDGGDGVEDATPFSIPVISNVTYIGSGQNVNPLPGGDENGDVLKVRDNAGGKYWNSIFTEFPKESIDVEDLSSGEDSRARLEAGDLALNNNWFWNVGSSNDFSSTGDAWSQAIIEASNSYSDPDLASISRDAGSNGLDPRPNAGSAALTAAQDFGDDWFYDVTYNGAFGTDLWLNGWTALHANDHLGDIAAAAGTITIADDVTSDQTWTASNTYMLDGLIFVDDGATLTIEPGTVIKGLEQGSITTGDGASALIIRRGGKIMADGNPLQPIIFTSELDDTNDALDLDQRDRGLWGGVIILGKATTNMPTTDNQIEGIDILTDPALYGGTDDHDNSGTLRYVSIRHGGFSISGVEGDEINGLTMGAVGDGTTIEYVEVFANFDDCYEWFGGTVNAKYLVGAFCGDDSYDYDQGFRGKGQFWFSIHDTDVAGRGGEHDGGDGVEDATPFSIPVISNVTYIGSGQNVNPLPGGDENGDVLKVRDNAGGKYWNSIFTEFPKESVDVEDLSSGEDSRARLEAGDLALNNNWFWNVGSSNDFSSTGDAWSQAIIEASNSYSDPDLAGICRTMDNCLDPRPNAGSAAMSAAVSVGDSFFDDVSYVGAFGENLWVSDWTALAANGFLGRISSVALEELEGTLPTTIELDQNYPNPFNPSTAIEYRVAASFNVRLAVYDILGREVAELVNDVQPAGSYRVTFDATGLTSGMYIYRLEVGGDVITKSMMLMK